MLDDRVVATCSLGPLIRADIGCADDLQQTGLVKYRGSCTLSGKVSAPRGTAVSFSYTKKGTSYTIPKKLYVSNSFYNPFERTTVCDIGCIFTLRGNTVKDIDVEVLIERYLNDAGISVADYCRIGAAFPSAWLIQLALDGLGVTATTDPPTEASYWLDRWDFSEGYVANISRLLEVEGYIADTNEDGDVVFLELEDSDTVGPYYANGDLISVSIASAGEEPAETATTIFTNQQGNDVDPGEGFGDRCTIPEPSEEQPTVTVGVRYNDWTRSVTINEKTSGPIKYGEGALYSKLYTEWTETITSYTEIDDQQYPERIIETRNSIISDLAGQWFGAQLQAGFIPLDDKLTTYTQTDIQYDRNGNREQQVTTVYKSPLQIASEINFPAGALAGTSFGTRANIKAEQTVVTYQQAGDVERTVTDRYEINASSITGQQSAALSASLAVDAAGVESFVAAVLITGLQLTGTTINFEEGKRSSRNSVGFNARLRSDAVASEDEERATVVFDSTGIQGFVIPDIEDLVRVDSLTAVYQLPLEPTINYEGTAGAYSQSDSLAEVYARRYATNQNRIRLGNKYAISIQVPAERMPGLAFTALYVELDNVVAQYRANQISWVIEPGEVVAGCNALFWGTSGVTESSGGSVPASEVPVPLSTTTTTITQAAPEPTTSPSNPEWGEVLDPGAILDPVGSSPVPTIEGYSATNAYTMTARRGVFAVSGRFVVTHASVDYAVLAARRIFSLQGKASTLTISRNYGTTANSGAFALTGEPAIGYGGTAILLELGTFDLAGDNINNPVVLDTVINSRFLSSSNGSNYGIEITAPTANEGDTMIAFVTWDNENGTNTLTPPSGWTTYAIALDDFIFGINAKEVYVCHKVATASEPSTIRWVQSDIGQKACAAIALSVQGEYELSQLAEVISNGSTAAIGTVSGDMNITIGRWARTGVGETYSQSIDTGSMTEITDSPKDNAIMSGGYTFSVGTVTSTHSTATLDPPTRLNHRMVRVVLDRVAAP